MSPNEPHEGNEPGEAAGDEGPEQRPSEPADRGETEQDPRDGAGQVDEHSPEQPQAPVQAERVEQADEQAEQGADGPRPDDDGTTGVRGGGSEEASRRSFEDELFEGESEGELSGSAAPGGAGDSGAPVPPGIPTTPGDSAPWQQPPGWAAGPSGEERPGFAPHAEQQSGPPAGAGGPFSGASGWQPPTGHGGSGASGWQPPAGHGGSGASGWQPPTGHGDTGSFSRPEDAYAAYRGGFAGGYAGSGGQAPPPGGHGGPGETASFGMGGHGQPPGGMPPYGPGHPQGHVPPQEPRRRTGHVITVAAITALVTSLVVGSVAAVGSAFLFSGGLGSPVSSLEQEGESTATEGEAGDVAEQVLPSVVSIQASGGGGSGVVISSDGKILTNSHVVQAAEGGELEVMFNDGSGARAEILGADPVSDIAVIQAEGQSGLTPAQLGDSDQVGVGGEVIAIGSPLGLSGTVTTGIVSALDRPVNTGASENQNMQTSTVINAIQTDAAINPGNSGGPLVNMAGEVVGINTAIAGVSQESGSVGLGFAIPINQVQPIAEQLIEDGSASYPAIEATVSGNLAGGAQIVEVSDGGAADQAGLEPGDVVVAVEDREVNAPDQLIAEIRSNQAGDEISLGVLRGGNGDEEEVRVTLGEQSGASVEEGEQEED
ncbi:trypsin-like peptidase domain-containing protein [Nocardiopsis xinjiangensis]|uniref:trypsin-like peptidase domain-containing protein n=1 Tax=Nocardiopsis xinjiangensis TaxID=124285 RepID=UPI00034D1F1C|nr:trypsin-like peptidase domain-containing protein [Nocardiopsis xinjiangensis]